MEHNENKGRTVLNGRHLISKKFEELRKEVDSNEMKECTFRPTVNPNPRDKNPRKVN